MTNNIGSFYSKTIEGDTYLIYIGSKISSKLKSYANYAGTTLRIGQNNIIYMKDVWNDRQLEELEKIDADSSKKLFIRLIFTGRWKKIDRGIE